MNVMWGSVSNVFSSNMRTSRQSVTAESCALWSLYQRPGLQERGAHLPPASLTHSRSLRSKWGRQTARYSDVADRM